VQIRRHSKEASAAHQVQPLVVVLMVCTKLVVERFLHVEVRGLRTSLQMVGSSQGASRCTRLPCRKHCFWQDSDSVCTTVLTVTLSKKKIRASRGFLTLSRKNKMRFARFFG